MLTLRSGFGRSVRCAAAPMAPLFVPRWDMRRYVVKISSSSFVHDDGRLSTGCSLLPSARPHLLTCRIYCTPPHHQDSMSLGKRLAVAGMLGSFLLAGWFYMNRKKQRLIQEKRQLQLDELGLGQPAKNVPLVDHTGATSSLGGLAGKWLLLYFGFTHCPDVCPESMEQLTGVVNVLDMDSSLLPIQPVFITVDPERDDPKALALYIKDFHPRLIGLTGSPENVQRVTKAFRVFNSRGPPTADGDYLVDHSVLIFLVDPRGLVRDFFARDHPLEKMTSSITRHIQQG
uniref:protein SCO2 homolog, mitochondrial-like n=1 Tax=Myxine glutinosa TaxID=7769 RepID=UPI00358E2C5A